MKQARVILSIGFGRLHLIQSARALSKAGLKIAVICGWVPKDCDSRTVRLCSWLVRRNLSAGLKKRRVVDCDFVVRSSFWVEAFYTGVRSIFQMLHISVRPVVPLLWDAFGLMSRRHIHDAEIFHVRSGAGQGGAIRCAKKRGLRILVDHSALHPATSARNLKDDYSRWGITTYIRPDQGVWINVLKDCREADLIMVNANHIRDSFIENGYPPERVRVVYLGVDESFSKLKKDYSSSDEFKILFTGNVSILKGVEYILQASLLLKRAGVRVRVTLIGAIEIPEEMRKKYADAPVEYIGWMPQEQLKAFLANSDVYLFPSLADGCAQSGMEALAAGLPVVATYQSGLPIADGETGYLIPMKDASAIAEKIKWIIAHQVERERIGKQAAEMMSEKYTWKNYAENVKRLYSELLRA